MYEYREIMPALLNFLKLNQAMYVQSPKKNVGFAMPLCIIHSLTSRNLSVTQCHKAKVWTVLTLAAHSISSQKNGVQDRIVRILCETVLSNL
jgi:hypothetical protein